MLMSFAVFLLECGVLCSRYFERASCGSPTILNSLCHCIEIESRSRSKEILILVDRTLADSQELLIAISKSYSFPGMHYVTSEEGKGADGQILISRVITYFPSCPSPPFLFLT